MIPELGCRRTQEAREALNSYYYRLMIGCHAPLDAVAAISAASFFVVLRLRTVMSA
jgi:hypothetical protein